MNNRLIPKNRWITALSALLLFCQLAGCSPDSKEPHIISTMEQMNSTKYSIGVPQGAAAMTAVENNLPKSHVAYFASLNDGYMAVKHGKIDAFSFDRHLLQFVTRQNPDLAVMDEKLGDVAIGVGASLKKTELIAKVNDFIRQYRADGTYKDMYRRWMLENITKMPDLPEPENPVMTLKIGMEALNQPMAYYENEQLTGFDVEFVKRVAIFLNAKPKYVTMDFAALIPAAISGKIDIIVANLNATPERRKKLLFSDSYIDSDVTLLVRKNRLAQKTSTGAMITDISQLDGKKVGITTGSVFDSILKKNIPGAVPQYFDTIADQIQSLKTGKISSFIIDGPGIREIMSNTAGLSFIKKPLAMDYHAFAIAKNQTELHREVNIALRELEKSGVIKEIEARWEGTDEAVKILPVISNEGKSGVIRFATQSTAPPSSYIKNGTLAGYEIEIAMRIAEKLGRKLEIVTMDFGGILPSLVSGKSDMAGGSITVTEERAKSVLFTDPLYSVSVVAVVLSGADTATEGFWGDIRGSFNRTFLIEGRYKLIFQGLQVTLLITVLSAIFGTLLGFGVCMMRRSRSLWMNLPARAFIRSIQGTPIVLLLMILYYIVFSDVDIDAVLVAIIGFSINFAGYVSEMMRAGIDSVDNGQHEAASAIGFNRLQVFSKITFPQAARFVLPVFKGELISMLKMTAVVGYIAIQDLTKMSDIIRSRTYEAFFPLISTALIYFSIAYIMIHLLTMLEKKIDPMQRKRVIRGVVKS